jgi:hypothetical protein
LHCSGHAFPRTEAVVNSTDPGESFILRRRWPDTVTSMSKFTRLGQFTLLCVRIAIMS